MAYNPHNLSVLAYANGHTFWHYTTNDSKKDVLHPAYLDTIEMVCDGDSMIINTSTGGMFAFVKIDDGCSPALVPGSFE